MAKTAQVKIVTTATTVHLERGGEEPRRALVDTNILQRKQISSSSNTPFVPTARNREESN